MTSNITFYILRIEWMDVLASGFATIDLKMSCTQMIIQAKATSSGLALLCKIFNYFLICVNNSDGGFPLPGTLLPKAEKAPPSCLLLKAPNPPPAQIT